MSRRRTACSLRPFSRDAERGQATEEGTSVALGGRGDENGVVTGKRSDRFFETRRVERSGEGVRGPRKRPQDDEIRRERAFDGVVLTKPAQPLDAISGGGRGRRRVGMVPVTRDLHEPELDDVTRHRRLSRGEAHATERTDDVGLRGEPLLRNDTKQGLLPVMLARERVPHAAASKTVPTCSPARSRSTESTPRVATIAARHPAAAAMRHASTFGSMPPSIVPSSTSARALSASSRAMTRPSFPRTPGTSVTNTSKRAPRLAAMAPAAASPLTLRTSPDARSSAAGATIGTLPAATSGWPPSLSATTASSDASFSAPTEPPIFSTRRSLRGVVGIDPHVLLGEVRSPGFALALRHPEVDRNAKAGRAEDLADALPVEGTWRAGFEYVHVPDANRRSGLVDLRPGSTGGREDAAPVGIGAMDRGLHQGRRCDRARGEHRFCVRRRTPDQHLEDPRHAFAVGEDLLCEVSA